MGAAGVSQAQAADSNAGHAVPRAGNQGGWGALQLRAETAEVWGVRGGGAQEADVCSHHPYVRFGEGGRCNS